MMNVALGGLCSSEPLLCYHLLLLAGLPPSGFAGSPGKGRGATGKADAAIKLCCVQETCWVRHICHQPGDTGPSWPNTSPKGAGLHPG